LAAQISLCGLYADVPEQELDLFKLSACLMAKSRAGSSQIMWRELFKLSL